MRMGIPTQRDRRAVLVGVLLVVPALVVRFGAVPYVQTLRAMEERVAAQRELLQRELALVANTKRFPILAARAQSVLAVEAPRLFAGSDLYTASGGLSSYVGEQAGRSHLLIQRSEGRVPSQLEDGLDVLDVDLQAVGDLRNVLGFLSALETGPKFVRVEGIRLERSGDGNALIVTVRLRGYARQPVTQ